MHMFRRGDRHQKVWNYACDTILDNMMDLDGYLIDSSLFPPELFPPGSETFKNHAKYGTLSAEEIYDDMMKDPPPPPMGGGGAGGGSGSNKGIGQDLIEGEAIQHQVINVVVAAAHSAKLAGNLPGNVETILNKFLAPKIDWKTALYRFFNDLGGSDYSWSRPNRRYQNVYLPSIQEQYEGLEHVIYYEDVSGSITDEDALRFNSEFKHVHDYFQPEKMTMVQFDTRIQKEDVFLKDDPFEEVKIVGRGGTSLICVRDHIIKHQPTAVVVFSDLHCHPMEPLPSHLRNIPIIWIALNNRSAVVPHGTIVHLKE